MALPEEAVVEEDAQVEGFRLETMADALAFSETSHDLYKRMEAEDEARRDHIGQLETQRKTRKEHFESQLEWREGVLLDWYRRNEKDLDKTQPLAAGVEVRRRSVPEKDRILWPESVEAVPKSFRRTKTVVQLDKKGIVAAVKFSSEGVAVVRETGEVLEAVTLDPAKPPVTYKVVW